MRSHHAFPLRARIGITAAMLVAWGLIMVGIIDLDKLIAFW